MPVFEKPFSFDAAILRADGRQEVLTDIRSFEFEPNEMFLVRIGESGRITYGFGIGGGGGSHSMAFPYNAFPSPIAGGGGCQHII